MRLSILRRQERCFDNASDGTPTSLSRAALIQSSAPVNGCIQSESIANDPEQAGVIAAGRLLNLHCKHAFFIPSFPWGTR